VPTRFKGIASTAPPDWQINEAEAEDPTSRNSKTALNSKIAFFLGAFLVVAVISATFAQSRKVETAPIRLAYSQVFTDPQDATCPNPRHRKVKTSKGYRWRWVC
jgi:hypothetical protein